MTLKAKTAVNEDNAKPTPKFVAPDGGWGWVIVFASALSNVIVIPILQSFGLLFKDKFIAMGMTTTDCSIIINVNSAFGMGLGLLIGPLLRRFSFRKVAMAGSILVFIGVSCLSWANTFMDFIIFYSLITSLGTILAMASFSLALNTYFKLRRGRAAGIAMTATGLGPIIMPQLISASMQYYGIEGTALLLGGLSLHSFMAALLLHPVKWHLQPLEKDVDKEAELENEEDGYELEVIGEDDELNPKRRRYISVTSNAIELDIDTKSMYGFETPLIEKRKCSITSDTHLIQGRPMMTHRSISHADEHNSKTPRSVSYDWWSTSVETVNLGSSIKIFEDRTYAPLPEVVETLTQKEITKENKYLKENQINKLETGKENSLKLKKPNAHDEVNVSITKKEKQSFLRKTGNRVVTFFDLDLLSDPHYVSLMIGMSLASTAELNFSLFTPFIMAAMGFTTSQIAIIMSTIATADIIFRFLAPFIGDALKLPSQYMYYCSLIMLVLSRTTLTFFNTYQSVLIVGVFLGISKGFRTVYMTLVIPAYVPLERLPAASGIQMVTNGVCIMIFGPFLGLIRDWSGSFNTCIMALNCLTLATLTLWTVEFIIFRYRKRKVTEVKLELNLNNNEV